MERSPVQTVREVAFAHAREPWSVHLCALAAIALLSACASQPGVARPPKHSEVPASLDRPPPAAASRSNIVALLGNEEITWEDIRPGTLEAGSGVALREAILDRMLARELASQGLEVSPADVDAERTLLIDAIARTSRVTDDEAPRLLERIRRSRGMGQDRFEAQLRRTASLRRLVAGSIQISDDEVARRHELLHGSRYRARLILVKDQARASQLHETLAALPLGERESRFESLALAESIDPSARLGGQLEPISPVDPAYPDIVRRAIASKPPDRLTPILAVDRGYAVLFVQGEIPGDAEPLDATRDRLQKDLRLVRERVAMDDTAARMLREKPLSILWPDVAAAYALSAPGATAP
jgi:parvulin-like peptidyl-prolyl isomerase